LLQKVRTVKPNKGSDGANFGIGFFRDDLCPKRKRTEQQQCDRDALHFDLTDERRSVTDRPNDFVQNSSSPSPDSKVIIVNRYLGW
jgi:hypothetical protein